MSVKNYRAELVVLKIFEQGKQHLGKLAKHLTIPSRVFPMCGLKI